MIDTASPTEIALDVRHLDGDSCDLCQTTIADVDEGPAEAIDCRPVDRQRVTCPAPPAELIAPRDLAYPDGALPTSPAAAAVPDPASVERFVAARIAQATRAAALRRRIRGTVMSPGDDGDGTARGTFTTMGDRQPALVAVPADVDDVVAVVDFAREHGLRVVPQHALRDGGGDYGVITAVELRLAPVQQLRAGRPTATLFGARSRRRRRALRKQVDPDGMFRAHHPLPVAG